MVQGGIPDEGLPPGGARRGPRQKWVDKMQPNNYWSGTAYAANPGNAWNFNFNDGNQNVNNETNEFYAWAVHSGE